MTTEETEVILAEYTAIMHDLQYLRSPAVYATLTSQESSRVIRILSLLGQSTSGTDDRLANLSHNKY